MPSRRLVIPHSRPTVAAEDVAAVSRVLKSGNLAQGREVQAFEEEMAATLGLQGGVATSSGTAALHLALLALGLGPGAEVLIPSYTCVAVLHAVHLAGARPRIVDCEPGGVNMWAHDAARQATPATRAVILPHMFGQVAPVEEFHSLGVPVIEDCAQALGAQYRGRPAGSTGDVTVLSFYATKMITTGEGGMVLSRSAPLLAEARDRRDYDGRQDYRQRFNYKMSDVQAALGRSQLRKLSRFVNRRRAIARRYHAALESATQCYTPPDEQAGCYRYVVHVSDVDGFASEMLRHGVECKRPVYQPLHTVVGAQSCSNADRVFQHALSLPLYPSLSDDDAAAIGQLAAGLARESHDRVAESV